MGDGRMMPLDEEEIEKLIEAFSVCAEVADAEALHAELLKQTPLNETEQVE